MSFRFGASSEENLVGVDGGLVTVARRTLTTTPQDFSIFEGLRLLARQKLLVASGASRTLNSFHIADAQGVGHALDLVPYVGGHLQWQLPLSLKIIVSLREAGIALGIALISGIVWDRKLHELDPHNLEHEIALAIIRYQKTHPPIMINGKLTMQYPLVDGPHIQTATR